MQSLTDYPHEKSHIKLVGLQLARILPFALLSRAKRPGVLLRLNL